MSNKKHKANDKYYKIIQNYVEFPTFSACEMPLATFMPLYVCSEVPYMQTRRQQVIEGF